MQKSLCISLMIFIMASCSIKEDRSDCPCLLTIDITSCKGYVEPLSLKGWNEATSLFGKKVQTRDYPDGIKIMVPRGNVHYSVFTAVPSYHQTGSVISCPTGSLAMPLFAYRQTVVAAGETAYDKVLLHKQYAVLNISFGQREGNGVIVSEMSIRAEYNGMSTDDLSPQKGRFENHMTATDGFFTLIIPRQGQGAIDLKAYANGFLVRDEDLAGILKDNGYDWNAEDLDDIWIDFDLGSADCKVEIQDWKTGESYSEII